ncbi:hypothetical protein V8E51_005698 [Hyaloscypha variabilis]
MAPATLVRAITEQEFKTMWFELQAEKDPLIRMTRKEKILKLGVDRIKQLKPLLEENAPAFPKYGEWLQQISEPAFVFFTWHTPIFIVLKTTWTMIYAISSFALVANCFCTELLEHRTQEGAQVLIGVLGSTRSGKSSLINAILDQSVVPSSCFRACTSCVVEIRWNESTHVSDKYSADIQYITPQQWASELEILTRDVMNGFESDEVGDDQSATKAAVDKLRVLYPGIETEELLSMTIEHAVEYLGKVQDFSGILGRMVEVRESTAQAFSQKINGVIGSNDQTVCWPLVHVVRVRSRAPILQNGILDQIWVVAEIKRAVDESVARELLGNNFRRQLLMENKYEETYLALIATHTDDIDYNEVIHLLQGTDEALTNLLQTEKIQKDALQAITKQRKEIQKNLKKINTERKSRKTAQRAAKQREVELQTQVSSLRLQVLQECVGARNRWLKNRLQADFATGQAQLIQKAKQSRMSGSGNGGTIAKCNAYQSFQKKAWRATKLEAFPDRESTEVPQLQKHAMTSTLGQRERTAGESMNNLRLIYNELRRASTENASASHGVPEDKRVALLSSLDEKYKLQKQLFQKILHNIESRCQLLVEELESTLEKAVADAPKAAAKQCERIISQKIPPQTWKAICTRGGFYTTVGKHQKHYDWQQDFAAVILLPFTGAWHEIINKEMSQLLEQHEIDVLREFRTFGDGLQNMIVPVCNGTTYQALQGIIEMKLLLENEAKARLSSIRRLRNECAQDITDAATRVVKQSLQPHTSKMSKENGKGVGKRKRDLLSDHINQTSKQMYTTISNEIRKILNREKQYHFKRLSEVSLNASSRLFKAVRRMFENPPSQLSVVAQSSLLSRLSIEVQTLEKLWKDAIKQPGWGTETSGSLIKNEDSGNFRGDEEDGSDDDDMTDGESDGEEEDLIDKDEKKHGRLVEYACA